MMAKYVSKPKIIPFLPLLLEISRFISVNVQSMEEIERNVCEEKVKGLSHYKFFRFPDKITFKHNA